MFTGSGLPKLMFVCPCSSAVDGGIWRWQRLGSVGTVSEVLAWHGEAASPVVEPARSEPTSGH
jgi:hypothetical protein